MQTEEDAGGEDAITSARARSASKRKHESVGDKSDETDVKPKRRGTPKNSAKAAKSNVKEGAAKKRTKEPEHDMTAPRAYGYDEEDFSLDNKADSRSESYLDGQAKVDEDGEDDFV